MLRFALLAVLFLGFAAPSAAEYPERALTIVVAYPAGGMVDIAARPMADSNQDSKIPRGTVMDTTQFGTSTISLILRSPATLQMAYASCRLRP